MYEELNGHILSLTYGNYVSVEIYAKLWKEKQNLIKYLENHINDLNEVIKEHKENNLPTSYEVIRVSIFQEMLDKIKEGNYE